MAVIDDIIVWAATLPPWQADVVRRLLSSVGGELQSHDFDEILELAKWELELAERAPAIAPVPPALGMFSGVPTAGTTVILKCIEDVQSVNVIRTASALTFGEKGVTIIYGKNGSGKSGYARILKLACSARDKSERILPDVFKPGTQPPPSAILTVVANDVATVIPWSEAAPVDPVLTNITVFDARCARVIVDDRSQVNYLPYGAEIFEKLAVVVKRVKSDIERGIESLEPFQDSGVVAGTASATFLQGISAITTAEEAERACQWAAPDETELKRLQELVRVSSAESAGEEITKLGKTRQRVAASANAVATLVTASIELTDESMTEALSGLVAARRARDKAVAERESKDPLPGAGPTNEWQILYEAAKRYSEAVAYRGQSFPNTNDDALCVLCQQPLGAEATERFVRFKRFMEDTTSEAFKRGQEGIQTLRLAWEGIRPWEGHALDSVCDDLRPFSAATADELMDFHRMLTERKKAALAALRVDGDSDGTTTFSAVPVSVEESIRSAIKAIDQRTEGIRDAARPDEYKRLVASQAELQSRKALNARRADVSSRLTTLKRNASIRRAADTIKTNDITRQGTALIRKNLTPALFAALKDELQEMGASRIPISVKPSGDSGETTHEFLLAGAQAGGRVKLSQVLSEGEQRVIAIAGFLAELGITQHANPVVFDDPVSSLDHKFLGRIASRLVREGLKRQVIVFTHDISFLMEAHEVADNLRKTGATIEVSLQTLRKVGKDAGVNTVGAPWQAQKVPQRAHELEQRLAEVRALHTADTDAYNRRAAEIYGLLREAWESSVEDDLFHAVVCRYRNSVKTLQLAGVAVEDQDVRLVELHMSKCSTWMTGHDRSKALDEDRPAPDELLADIKALRDFSTAVTKRRDTLKGRRNARPAPAPPNLNETGA